jgi:hypothetical protein
MVGKSATKGGSSVEMRGASGWGAGVGLGRIGITVSVLVLVLGEGLVCTGFTTTSSCGGGGGGGGGVVATTGGVMTGAALITGGEDCKDMVAVECWEEKGEAEEEELLLLSLGLKEVVEFVLSSISPQYSSNFWRRLFLGFFFFLWSRGSFP